MSTIINTNSLSLLTQNNLNKSQASLNTAIQRLSSGLRINSAKDDAAGQAIANRFTANIKGLTQSQRNANDGISLAQTTEGALGEVNTNLQRIRELAVQSANGSNSAADKTSIQAEITQRLQEIDRTSAQTDFNGVKVLASTTGKLSIQIGANDNENISIDLQEISSKTLGLTGFNVDGAGSANKAAGTTDLLVAGFTAGTSAGGVTPYTRTLSAAAGDSASANDVLGKIQNGGTVTVGTAVSTYNSATSSYTTAETGRTGAPLIASLTPPAGQTQIATVTLGGKSTNVRIDSAGSLTDAADGSALFLDSSKNLTKTGTGTTIAATVSSLTNIDTGAQIGDTIKIGATGATFVESGTVNTATAPAASNSVSSFNVTNEPISAAAIAAKVNSGVASSINIDGTSGATSTFAVTATTGVVTQGSGSTPPAVFKDLAGSLTTNTTQTVRLSSNGIVTDTTGNAVFNDSTKPGKLTTSATSGSTVTVDSLKTLDAALSKVDKLRGALGAVQNRFDSVISNLGTTINNLTSSRSRIEDADYATEVSNLTRAQILQQAGTSVLAKANQSTEGVLSLLR